MWIKVIYNYYKLFIDKPSFETLPIPSILHWITIHTLTIDCYQIFSIREFRNELWLPSLVLRFYHRYLIEVFYSLKIFVPVLFFCRYKSFEFYFQSSLIFNKIKIVYFLLKKISFLPRVLIQNVPSTKEKQTTPIHHGSLDECNYDVKCLTEKNLFLLTSCRHFILVWCWRREVWDNQKLPVRWTAFLRGRPPANPIWRLVPL